MLLRMLSITLALIFYTAASAQEKYIHHRITAAVEPEKHFIEAVDNITIPPDQMKTELHFLLVSDLTVASETPGVTIRKDESKIKAKDFGMDQEDFEVSSSITQNKYSIVFAKGITAFALKLSGKIHYTIKQMGAEYARSFSQSPGIIDEKGVFLGGSTYWVPWFNDRLITFELTTSLPETWDAVSQGKRTRHEVKNGRRMTRWDSPEPMEEIFLIAAKFSEYSTSAGAVNVMAFLRTPAENLANKYLETTAQYLEMYRKLVGPYPFSKFALVENFWETGYGMPSFTLLGQQIIRFPFILHSSYPHELLHNWWGNSAYVDFKTGNWCEGITVYMADYLIKEQRGQGMEYRRSTLQKYTDYVNPANDFPLNKFLSRHNASSEAIGYGKCMMMWNMLREDVGDQLFVKGFQTFYRNNKFKAASFADIRKAFESVTNRDLAAFFHQWVDRTGAPELALSGVSAKKTGDGYRLQFTVGQIQEGDVFVLNIPIAISLKKKAEIKKVKMAQKQQSFSFDLPAEPLSVRVDPQFDLFRKLNYNEISPSLSKIFGAEDILILLPSRADKSQFKIYENLANIWAKDKSKKIRIIPDSRVSELPADKPVWLFGWQNLYRYLIEQGLQDYNAEIQGNSVRLGKSTFSGNSNSYIVSVRHPRNHGSVIVWLAAEREKAIDGLARKLPHYGKYSYLVFEGDEPANIAKGQWPAVNSPLHIKLTDKQPDNISLPKRPALVKPAPLFSAKRMLATVKYLAGDELEGRGLGSAGIEKAAQYIVEQFKKAGLKPAGENGTYFQTWQETVDNKGNKAPVKNIIGFIPGEKKEFAGESVVVSAHYDHLGYGWPDMRKGNEGRIHHGADDNASGIAVMLELARLLGKNFQPDRTVIFAAFTAEESGLLGSQHYVKTMQQFPVKKVIADLNLDTVGRLGENKLLVLNSSSAKEWKFIFMGTGYVTGVDADMVTQELDASDQMSFIKAGVPAVQFFSGPNLDYHRPSDTADKIDAAGMVKIAAFVREALVYLSEREKSLTFTGGGMKKAPQKVARTGRRAATGTMPDFAFSGKGVKIGGVAPDSPAVKAGLQKGDVIIRLGGKNILDLRDYSNALKTYSPGDEAMLVYIRNGKKTAVKIKFGER